MTVNNVHPSPEIREITMFGEPLNQQQMLQNYVNDSKSLNSFINKSKWSKIRIFDRAENNRRRALLITKPYFIKHLQNNNN